MTDETKNPEKETAVQDQEQADPSTTEPKTKGKTYTEEEVEAMIQKRLDRDRKSAQKQAEIDKLDGEAKLKAQYDMDRENLTRERDEAQKELRIAKAGVALSKLGLSPDFAPQVIGESDEATQKNIDSLAELVNKQVQETVASKMKRGAPPVTGETTSQSSTLENKLRASAGLAPKK